MKRILFLITKDDVGGAKKYVLDLAHHLSSQEFEVVIKYGGKEPLRALSNTFRPYLLFLNEIRATYQIYKLLKKIQPDILHLNSSKTGVVGAFGAAIYKRLSRKPVKVIFTAHGWVFNPTNRLSFWRQKFYILLHRLAARFQDEIISVSEYDHALARKFKIAPLAKLSVVRNGVDVSKLNLLTREAARKDLFPALPKGSYLIGSIGRLVREKDYATLIRAAALTRENIYFLIIGSGIEENRLRMLIEELDLKNRFLISSTENQAAQYLKAFDLFVLSSIKEGLPYTLIEAFFSEVPVVTTAIGGMPEILENRGELVPERNPSALAAAIVAALDNPKKTATTVIAAHDYAKQELSLERMISATSAIYRR